MHKMAVVTRLMIFPKIYKGKHLDSPHCSYLYGRKITVESKEIIPIAADGELLGTTPCEIELLPKILHVAC